jgi:hypothetical protein
MRRWYIKTGLADLQKLNDEPVQETAAPAISS